MSDTVLVIGAGPVGLTLALELTRFGVPVRIIDKSAARTDKSKALVVWSRTLELLEPSSVVDSFLASGHRLLAANMYAGSRRIGHVDLTTIDSRYNYALMLPQSKTEELLETHLVSLGIRVEREVEALELTQSGNAMEVTLRKSHGELENLRTPWVLGCDGAHSLVRHQLGLQFEGTTMQTDWVLADVHLKGWNIPDTELATYWHAEGALAAFPISPGRYRVIADVGVAEGPKAPDPQLALIQSIVDRRGPGGVTVHDPVWLSGFRINERKVAAYRQGRAFLVGDAAHVHSPAGGQGMNTGMQDAFNLAWKLALVCQGRAAEEPLLSSYSTERSAVGRKVLADANRLTVLATLRNPFAVSARNALSGLAFSLSSVREAMAKNFSEIGIHYPDSPLNGLPAHGIDGPVPGERAAPATNIVSTGGPKFTLHGAPAPPLLALITRFAQILSPDVQPMLSPGGVWLVRPDGYVAAVARAEDLLPLDDYLTRFMRSNS